MSRKAAPHRVVLAVSGASGAAIGLAIAARIAPLQTHELHLVVTRAGERTIAHELGREGLSRLLALADVRHAIDDIGAPIASGTFTTRAMIIAPCSIRSLSAIAAGLSGDLLTRAADVHLKERRRLLLMVRETPLHLGHLRAMATASELGAVVMPPVPAFYRHPRTVTQIIEEIADRAVQLALPEIETDIPEWG